MNAAAFVAQLQQLLPPGQAWPRDSDATLTKLLNACAEGLADIDARADDLVNETDTRTATEMIMDWERVLALPDSCNANINHLLDERRRAAHAKLTTRGGQSKAFYVNLAKKLGYDILVSEFKPFTCDSECEDPLCDEPWRFVWQVNAPETTIREFSCDSPCEEPLRSWGNKILECAITHRKPAHTHVIFAYGD